jgi:hypothetical protein
MDEQTQYAQSHGRHWRQRSQRRAKDVPVAGTGRVAGWWRSISGARVRRRRRCAFCVCGHLVNTGRYQTSNRCEQRKQNLQNKRLEEAISARVCDGGAARQACGASARARERVTNTKQNARHIRCDNINGFRLWGSMQSRNTEYPNCPVQRKGKDAVTGGS